MAQNKAIEIYNGLPQWAKGVVAVGGIGIAFYIGYTLIRRVRKNAEMKADMKESDTAIDDLKKLEQQGIRPTISNTQAESICTALTEAMNGCGTDEEAIYNQFKKLNNIADVQLLIAKWGIRYYRPCAATQPISYSRYLFNDKAFGGNISALLNYDLSQSEIQKINKLLSDKRINYKF
jgi:hypothetical protein